MFFCIISWSMPVIAIAMAGIAYVATRGEEPTEREVTAVAQPAPAPEVEPSGAPEKAEKIREKKPKVVRGDVYVEVYNNSSVTGLAGRVAQKVGDVGWQVVGADNWYGTIPTSTVYYPAKLERAATLLALDLGIERTAPAVEPMRMDRLTLILTGELG